MKVEERQINVIESGDMQRKRKLSFDEDSLQHLMSVLTELYADPIMAVVREYITNAYDSHIEAGQTKPIEVTLPNAFKSEFVVQDYGVGMSLEELEEIYSKYGASTKRDSNDYVGMLGLGCKSALAYADQFWVVSVKDGKRTVALITRDEDGGSSIDIKEHEATSEPNGFTVKINSKDYSSLKQRVEAFLWYWRPGLVTIDGAPHKSIFKDDDTIWVDDDKAIVDNYNSYVKHFTGGGYYSSQRIIVQGGVPYPVEFNASIGNSRYTMVHFAPIGSVHPAPPRESLKDNLSTQRYIKQLEADTKVAVDKFASNITANCKNIIEATKAIAPLGVNATYKGVNIPALVRGEDYKEVRNIVRNSRAESSTSGTWQPRETDTVLVVGNYAPEKFSISNYHKITRWRDATGKPNKQYKIILLLANNIPVALKYYDHVDWDAINTWARKNGHAGRTAKGSDRYSIWDKAAKRFVTQEADPKVEYVIYTDARNRWGLNPRRIVEVMHPNKVLVCEPRNRHEKFLRNNPKSVSFDMPDIKQLLDKMLGVNEITYMRYNREYNNYDPKSFDDPAIRDFLKIVAKGENVDLDAIACYNEVRKSNHYYYSQVKPLPDPFDNYEVVSTYSSNIKQVVEAVNAIYAYRKGK